MMSRFTAALSLLCAASAALPSPAQNQAWIRQFGTSGSEYARDAAPDGAGGVYVGGAAGGSLGGPHAGADDAWLARYDSAGNQLWIRQFGTLAGDAANAVTPDGSGGVYVGGHTSGSLGGPNAGLSDAWLARYDSAGNLLWIRQFGTSGGESLSTAAPDGSGGVYVGGETSVVVSDVWLSRYDSGGAQVWTRQFGSSNSDLLRAAAPDGSGGAYVSGYTNGNVGGQSFGGWDAWLARYDSAGIQVWIRQFGTLAGDSAWAAAPDGLGGVYLGGATGGSLGGPHAGNGDAWLARFDNAGSQTWIRQFGTSAQDGASAAAPDGSGGVYVSGDTYGNFGGPNAGLRDAWLARYDNAGSQIWIHQLGSDGSELLSAAAPDGSGGVYVTGDTNGILSGGSQAGLTDVFLARYCACGCASAYCTSSATTSGCAPSISGTGLASASAGSGFTISVANVEGQRSGLIFYGIDNTGWTPQPWDIGSSSYLCVRPPRQRTFAQSSGGTIGACNGTLSIDWNAFIAGNPGALGSPFAGGETVYAQGWFRDPAAPKTTNLSNGLQFSVCP